MRLLARRWISVVENATSFNSRGNLSIHLLYVNFPTMFLAGACYKDVKKVANLVVAKRQAPVITDSRTRGADFIGK